MKHKFIIRTIILTVVLSVVLGGCASVPPPSNETSCLLLIHRDKKGEYESFYNYWIYLDGSEEPVDSFKASNNFLLLDNLEPGEHKIDRVTLTSRSQSGEWVLANSSFHFEMKEGYVTILEKSFYTEMRKERNSSRTVWYSENSEWIPLTPEALEEAVEKFQNKDKDGLWRF